MSLSLPEFAFVRPRDVESAITARGGESGSRFLAGGTDLIVNIRRGLDQPALLIDLTAIDELRQLSMTQSGLHVGACVTLAALTAMPAVQEHYRALVASTAQIASAATRSLATVGGNLCLQTRCIYYNQSEWWRRSNRYCLKHHGDICHVAPQGQHCHAAFSGDLAPALLVLDAEVELAGRRGRRRLPIADLYRDDGRNHLTLDADEILLAVHLPPAPPISGYAKTRMRGAIDFPLAGAAVALRFENAKLTLLRVALTGTNSRPFRLEGTEALLGRALDAAVLRQLESLVQKQVQPMRTTTASAYYRRLAAAALVRKVVSDLAGNREEHYEL
jgi:4-hydroxybenzoyl-CoA reductase subunit beta